MKDLIELIAVHLVDRPDKATVTELGGNHMKILELRVGPGDAGQVIGKNGRTAEALRTILSAVAAKQKKRVRLEIVA